MGRYDKVVNEIKSKSLDVTERTVPYSGGTLKLLFVRQMTDTQSLSEYIIKPIVQYCAANKAPLKAQHAMESIIFADDCHLEMDEARIEYHVLQGMVVMLFSNDPHFIVANLRQVAKRDVTESELTYNVRAPRDSFVEDLDTNLSLIRYRIKDRNIRIEYMEVGARTKARVAVLYLEDVANPDSVTEIKKRIGSFETDGILESGELQSFMLNQKNDLFPQMGIVERSDLAGESLLEGKILMILDGSNLALVAPRVFSEFFYSSDDRYDNKYLGLLGRIIRYSAIYLAFTATAYYIALVEFASDILPASYIIALAQMRSRAPFSAFIAVLVIEFIVELIREALLRVPAKIGSAIGIVAAIIIGQAAISSGIFTPVLLILVSIAFLSSFAIPDHSLINPFRVFKFVLIILSGTFGFFGMAVGFSLLLIHLVSINSFGVPYVAPLAPFKWYDFVRTFIFNKTMAPKRQQYMRTKDTVRTPADTDTYHPPKGPDPV